MQELGHQDLNFVILVQLLPFRLLKIVPIGLFLQLGPFKLRYFYRFTDTFFGINIWIPIILVFIFLKVLVSLHGSEVMGNNIKLIYL